MEFNSAGVHQLRTWVWDMLCRIYWFANDVHLI